MTCAGRATTLTRVETWHSLVLGRPSAHQAKGGYRMGIIEIVVIVLIVLFVVGFFGRGRFRA